MKKNLKILLIVMSLFQHLQAQIIQPIAPQTNCSNSFFVDYIANAKSNNNKDKLSLTGQFICSTDSIKDISFYIENSIKHNRVNNQYNKETCLAKIFSATFNNSTKNIYYTSNGQVEILKIRTGSLIQNNNLAIDINLLNVLEREREFVLVCEVIFNKGCKYIKKQKITL